MPEKQPEAKFDNKKKVWVKPTIAELDITKTEGGFVDIDWEGPTWFLFSS